MTVTPLKRRRNQVFRLGERGSRGRTRFDERWNPTVRSRTQFQLSRPPQPRRPKSFQTLSQIDWISDDLNEAPSRREFSRTVLDVNVGVSNTPEVATFGSDLVPRSSQQRVSAVSHAVEGNDPEEPLCSDGEEECYIDAEVSGSHPSSLARHDSNNETCLENSESNRDSQRISGAYPAEMRSKLRKVCRWQNVFAFLLLNGTGNLTVEQYNNVRVVVNLFMGMWNPLVPPLPAASTVQRYIQPFLQRHGFVTSHVHVVTHRTTDNTVYHQSSRIGSGNEDSSSFIVVLPSGWSEMDVSFKTTWNILKDAARKGPNSVSQPVFGTFESVPMVTNKDLVLDVGSAPTPTTVWKETRRTPLLLADRHPSETIGLHFEHNVELPPDVIDSMKDVSTETLDTAGYRQITVLEAPCIKSVLVSSGREHRYANENHLISRKSVIQSGNFTALNVPVSSLWCAGDICTFLGTSKSTEHILVLVQQHVRRMGLAQEMELICIPIEQSEGQRDEWRIEFDRSSRHKVSNISVTRLESVRPATEMTMFQFRPSFGILKDGRRFFVDHILLYSDGFSQYNFRQGSAGGVYAISLNYPPALRRSRERVRVLVLTPPGVSAMEGLRAIIDDLVESCTSGRLVRNADGEEMVLFTDIVGYVADYHETSYALDITGQNGKAPCHLCAFLRYNGHPSTASKYACTTAIHSSDACFARMGARTESIRRSEICDNALVDIGLNPKKQADQKNSPLQELSNKLKESIKSTEIIPLTGQGIPVVNPIFDPYRSVLVSPDHVLFGVTVNAINLAFSALPSNLRRMQADAAMCKVLRQNGLAKESEICNIKKSSVHASSISTRFCTLLMGPDIFEEVLRDCERCNQISLTNCSQPMRSLENLKKLRHLVTETYRYPNIRVDGARTVSAYNINGGLGHLAKLDQMCEDYIEHVNQLCKSFPECRAELDKPNIHRVLELYKHSIPAMGHVHHFAELLFEAAHQPLKKAMLRSNFRNSHLQSSRTNIAHDWRRRLTYVMNEPHGHDRNATVESQRELVRLLCGRDEMRVSEAMKDDVVLRESSSALRCKPLRGYLKLTSSKVSNAEATCRWVLSEPIAFPVSERDSENDVAGGTQVMEILQFVENFCNDFLVHKLDRDVKLYKRASRVTSFASEAKLVNKTPGGHDILHRETALQAWVEDENALCLAPTNGEREEEASLMYFAVECLMGINGPEQEEYENQSYAVVRKCSIYQGNLLAMDPSARKQLLALTDSVRRVGLNHACHKDGAKSCFSTRGTSHECNSSILSGNRFYYYGRDRGYPPRMA